MSDVLERRIYKTADSLWGAPGEPGPSTMAIASDAVDAADAAVDYEAGFEYLMATTQGFPTRIQFADAVREALGRDT